MASITEFDNMKRYAARVVDKKLWREARVDALKKGKSMADWLTEAIKEKLGKK